MLVARDLTKEYQSGTQILAVLKDVSFSIPQGTMVAIVGPSGSGKTTLLGLLAGLDVPSRGTVEIDSVDLHDLSEDARALLRGQKVGFVFQGFQLIPTLTAIENVQVPLELRGEAGAPARARELLTRVGLGDRLHHFPTQLSGGEQQRVAIARAFSNRPRILFADEPTGNLDGNTGARIVELLTALNREEGATVVLVTHDIGLAERTQRVIRLADGAVVEDRLTAAAAPEAGAPRRHGVSGMALGMLSRLAWRESRTARRRLLLYMSSISLGVAALVAIDSFAANTQESIRSQSRALLGGDVSFSSNAKYPAGIDSVFDSLATTGIPVARVTTFGSMAFVGRTGGTRLTQVRAVNDKFPLYGDIVTEPAGAWARLRQSQVALVDATLLVALDARVGDTLTIGYAQFEIAGALTSVPGDPGIASAIGPRVFIADTWLSETQLLGFGSRAQYETFVKLPVGVNSPKWAAPLRPIMLKANVRMRTVVQQEMSFTQAIGQMASFLGLVGLIALLLGGVGVASGVHAFVTRKVDTVAVFRCLGATSTQVLYIYLIQAVAMGLLGAALGALLGVAIQFGLPVLVKDFLPLNVEVSLVPVALGTGLAVGVCVALVFALRPLLALRRVSPLQALRRDDAALTRASLRDPATQLVNLTLVTSIILLAISRADTVPRGLMFAVGIGTSLVVLYSAAVLLSEGARRLVRPSWPYVLRQGIANLYRPANQTRSVVIALGFGSFLVTTLYLVQANLVKQFDITAAASRGNLILFDIQDDQRAGVEQIIRDGKVPLISMTPIVTMRIARINGKDITEHARASGQSRGNWGLRREYRSTYRDTVVPTEKVVAGQWFTPHTAADTLHEVSLASDLATEQLKVKLGDIIEWDVQGVRVATRLTSLRNVDFARFEPNFFAVFDPSAISGAPKQWAGVAAVTDEKQIARLQRTIVERYPNVSSLDISLMRRTITDIVDKVALAVRFLALFSLAMGIPVLFSAVAATRRDRLRESVLLKTLGATQRQVLRILFTEYALLGTLGGLCGMGLATVGGWALVRFVFEAPFQFAFGPAAAIAGAMLALAVGIGLLTGREVFRETPMAALREV